MLSLSTSILALACCGAVHAQTATSSNTSANSGGVETVVVTAERRAENLKTTAISATVLTGDDLQNKGINMVDALQFSVPNVTIDNFGQGSDFNIRGIGKAEHNSQTTTGVITYRDGVATFPGYIQEEPYYDVASIEVLRGPQGTIAGQNATGGAVFMTTNNPQIGGGYDGYAQAQFGNYGDIGLQGAVNIPISDTLAIRVAGYGEDRGSFYSITDSDPADHCANNKYAGCKPGYNPGDLKELDGRISVEWKPTDDLTVLFKTDYGYLDQGAYPADPFVDRFTGGDLFHITANAPQTALDRFVRSDLKVDYVLPDGITLQSVSGYQLGHTAYTADLDGSDHQILSPLIPGPAPFGVAFPVPVDNATFFDRVTETIYSQEFNIISPSDQRVTWLLGLYGQSNNYDFLKPMQFNITVPSTPPAPPALPYTLQGNNPETSLAAYGQVSVGLFDGVQAQFGARYTAARTTNSNVLINQNGLPLVDDQTAKSYNFSYKGALNWTINPDNFVYAFVSTGFRPGGLNVPVGLGNPAPFVAESVMSYETGWKSTLFDGHVRTDIDGFYNDYKNFQVSIGYPLFPVFSIEENVPGTTKIYGAEGDIEAVFDDLSFNGGVSLMHSELGAFFATDPRVASLAPCDPKTGPASPASCINLKGMSQTYAPNFTFNLGVQYNFHILEGDILTPRVNFGHVSDQWATLFEDAGLGDHLGARDILSAQLAWTHGAWVATLYGTNLTDQHYVGALNSGLDFAGPPRQFGIRLLRVF
jgi:iron complex outermembrane receptor protein